MNNRKYPRWLAVIAITLLALSCQDDKVNPDPIASFQFAPDANDFSTINFTNFSQNASSYSWDFGDDTALSTETNPSHTYAAEGTYTVTLTAKNADGKESIKSEDIEIIDPDKELKKLTGETSKTWKLIRDVSTGHYPFAVGPADRSQIWYAFGLQENLGNRPCILNDEYVFSLNGTYQYKTNGDIWADDGVWKASLGAPGCLANTAGNFVNVDNADISKWNDGTHAFTYNQVDKKITVTGLGAFIALAKVATDAEVKVPQTSVTYNVIKLVDADVDTLILETTIPAPGYWRFVLVSYDNPLDEPAMPTLPPPPGSIDVVNFDFETAGTPTWSIFGGTDFNGAGVTLTRIANDKSGGINTSGFIMKIDQVSGVQGWSGISTDLSGLVDFTNKQSFKVKVYSPAVGMTVKLKMEEVGNAGNNKEIDKLTTVANGWEELTFTFNVADANKWNRFVLFFDFQGAVKANASSFRFDSIVLQ
jgi:PKD repeat protein